MPTSTSTRRTFPRANFAGRSSFAGKPHLTNYNPNELDSSCGTALETASRCIFSSPQCYLLLTVAGVRTNREGKAVELPGREIAL